MNLSFICVGPAPVICLNSNTHIFSRKLQRRSAIFAWTFACISAVLCEGVSRHVTYAGFFGPKAVEILLESLQKQKKFKQTTLRGMIVLVLASAMMALAASRGHCSKKKITRKDEAEEPLEEEQLFDGAFGFLLN